MAEPPLCYSPEAFRSLLENSGPLWVGALVPSPHVIVVTGMYNEGEQAFVRITDPWDRHVGTPGAPGPHMTTHATGSRYIMRWEDFAREYESASALAGADLLILHSGGAAGRTPNYGSTTPPGYAQRLRTARAQAEGVRRYARAATTPEVLEPALPVRRLDSGAAGDVRWDLEQHDGLRRPAAAGTGPIVTPAAERTIRLDDWPLVRLPDGDVRLPVTVSWRYNAGAVGDVAIYAGDPGVVAGWTLAVTASVVDGADTASSASLGVNVRYVFGHTGAPDIVALSQLTLFGDGTYQRHDRWEQAEAGFAQPFASAACYRHFMASNDPVRGPATYDDLLTLPEHVVGEIIDGELFTTPRPAPRHAVAASALGGDLIPPYQGGRGGPGGWWVLFEPEIHLGRDVLVPDLAGWRRSRMPTMPDTAYFGVAPDWICEVLSPATARTDRLKKLRVYARECVAHAWLVDPTARTLEVLRLENARWSIVAVHGGDESVSAEPFDAITIALTSLWVEPAA